MSAGVSGKGGERGKGKRAMFVRQSRRATSLANRISHALEAGAWMVEDGVSVITTQFMDVLLFSSGSHGSKQAVWRPLFISMPFVVAHSSSSSSSELWVSD